LPRPLELVRSLRPLKTPWPAGNRLELDIEGTVHGFARTGQLVPAFRPAPERWFEAVVVIDKSASCAVWSSLATEFVQLLRQVGALRLVRTMGLDLSDETVLLRGERGQIVDPDQLRSTEGRRLILVVSDWADDAWYGRPMRNVLRSWAQGTPTVLVNPLSPRLWYRTALDLPAVPVQGSVPGSRNTQLRHASPGLPGELGDWIPVPVITLSPHSMGRWARTLMRSDPHGCDAVLLPPPGLPVDAPPPVPAADDASLVDAFELTASRPATRLAAFCAPYEQVSLPVLNLIRDALVPEAKVSDVAEVVVSGLFTVAQVGGNTVLRLRSAVASRLRRLLGIREAWRMYDVLSRHVAVQVGRPAMVVATPDPDGDTELPVSARPFAAAARETLRFVGAAPGRSPVDGPARRREPPDDDPAASGDPATRLRRYLDRLPPDERHHFLPRSRSSSYTQVGWRFIDRPHEQEQIAHWLRRRRSGMLIITGPAGVGKSALLGQLLVSSDPTLWRLIRLASLPTPIKAEQVLTGHSFDAAVWLAGLTVRDLVARLIRVALPGPPRPSTATNMDSLLHALRQRTEQFTILADELQAAREPIPVAHALRRLADVPGVRVVVGTRPSVTGQFDQPDTGTSLLRELGGYDESDIVMVPLDRTAVHAYVMLRLQSDGPQPWLSQHVVSGVADFVAGRTGSFRYARMAVAEILSQTYLLLRELPERGVSALAPHVPSSVDDIAEAAVRRLTVSPAWRGLLIALDFAQGRGVPQAGGVWATMAAAISSTEITDADIDGLLQAAEPYIIDDTELGRTVFRLADPAFASRLRTVGPQVRRRVQHLRILEALCRNVRADLPYAPDPYVAEFLPAHAALAGTWTPLEADPAVLDQLDPMAVAAQALRHPTHVMPFGQVAATRAAPGELAWVPPALRAEIRARALVREAARPHADSMVVAKIVVVGAAAPDRLRFLAAVVDGAPVTVDTGPGTRDGTRRSAGTPAAALVDIGRMTVDQDLVLYLFGTPHRQGPEFTWDEFMRDAIGAVVLVDSSTPIDSFLALEYLETRGIPHVVALGETDSPGPGLARIRRSLTAAEDDTPVLEYRATDDGTVRAVLIALVEHVLDIRQSGREPEH
jgi:signal recognition particle receptor subunit beta